MLSWFLKVPPAVAAKIQGQCQIEKVLPKHARLQPYPARHEVISLEKFNRVSI